MGPNDVSVTEDYNKLLTGSVKDLVNSLTKLAPTMKRPKIKEPFVKESMKIPSEINYTGDVNKIAAYLDGDPKNSEGQDLSPAARQHLIDRIVNVIYVNQRAMEFQNVKYEPLPAKKLGEDHYLLQGIHQPEHQQTGHCCWTMPALLMLQSRGVILDQETVRCYKPELVAPYQAEYGSEETIKEYTRDTDGNIHNLSMLMHKFLPNMAMIQSQYGVPFTLNIPERRKEGLEEVKTSQKLFKEQVTEALSKYRSPVAMLYGNHYRTIVGIQGDDLIVKDSNSYLHGSDGNIKVPIASLFQTPGKRLELTYLRDLSVTHEDALPSEIAPFKSMIHMETSGTEKGKLVFDTKRDVTLPNGQTLAAHSYFQDGNLPLVQFDTPIPGTKCSKAELWILPEKIKDNVVTLKKPEEDYAELDDRIPEEEKPGIGSKRSFEVFKRIVQEDSFISELPDSGYKNIMNTANEARHELNLEPTVKTTERCVRSLLFAKLVEAERALGNGKAGALEQSFDSSKELDTFLKHPKLENLYRRCPDASKMTSKDIESFVLNDTAGKIVREALTNGLDPKDKLFEEKKNKIINGTDPIHETERLDRLYKQLNDVDPALLISSNEFKKMKKNLEKVIKLRAKRMDIHDDRLSAVDRKKDAEMLAKAYDDLTKSARDYMNLKTPHLLKEGTIAKKRYDMASTILDFSCEVGRTYQKSVNSLTRTRSKTVPVKSTEERLKKTPG